MKLSFQHLILNSSNNSCGCLPNLLTMNSVHFTQSPVLPSYNVILVDWTGGASGQYPVAVNNLRVVGACAGGLAAVLQENGASLDMVHCIGHSLGGHTCGQMGKFVRNQTDSILGRISGQST